MPDLATKKKHLEELRNFHKPVFEMGIDRHKRNYDMHKR